jgi:hypothetical protein
MNRILLLSELAIDLGNIKNIRTVPYSGSDGGCYVVIELLKGHEYIFNPDTQETELIKPQIKEGFGKDKWADSFINTITEEWGKYLEYKDTPKFDPYD